MCWSIRLRFKNFLKGKKSWTGPELLRLCRLPLFPSDLPENTCVSQVTHRWRGKYLATERWKGKAYTSELSWFTLVYTVTRTVIDLTDTVRELLIFLSVIAWGSIQSDLCPDTFRSQSNSCGQVHPLPFLLHQKALPAFLFTLTVVISDW